jgi:hypothetical protein
MTVTREAGKREIVSSGPTTMFEGNDMIDFVAIDGKVLMEEAVFTFALRTFGNEMA